ncbi:MAG: YigZ family protein [Bacteroidaceae bacterium]|nr:YigZ family protein [Bacteroidaceae bacterium]
MDDKYLTITDNGAEGFYSEKRSRFLAFAHHVDTEEDVKRLVAKYRKKYFDARHVCYAYVLGYQGERTRANDDGEPAGSSGQPILRQLRSFGVTFTLVVVVRYYGGVNLGTGGLVVAYKTAAGEALTVATIEERFVMREFTASIPYAEVDKVMRTIRATEAEVINREYTATHTQFTIRCRLSSEQELKEKIGVPLAEAQ